MPDPPPEDREWYEQVEQQMRSIRSRRLRISDLAGAVLVSAVILGLRRSLGLLHEGYPSQIFDFFAWLMVLGGLGLAASLGGILSIGLGRVSTRLHAWGKDRAGWLGPLALVAAVLADFVGIALLMGIVLGITLFLAWSLLFGITS